MSARKEINIDRAAVIFLIIYKFFNVYGNCEPCVLT
jgi:hypothetical protein